MNEVQTDDNVKNESIYSIPSESLAETKNEAIEQMSAFKSGDHQNRSQFDTNYVPDYNWQANNQNLVHFEETDGKGFNYGDYYNYYSNYYQQLNIKSESTENVSNIETNSKERTIDLINKALAKQQLKSSNEVRDDDEEEGQIPPSPGIFNRSASRSPPNNSPYNTSHRSISRSHSRERSIRSHSRSRKRHVSRSRSPSTSRRRRRSRSRSPYFGPIIKDYRRGRRGFVRYPRGFRDRGGGRPYRRGHHSNYNYYGVSRRHEYSRSRSRSFSPKRRHIEIERIENNSDDEKTMDSKHSETLKPSDINETEKRLTQSFLAMLEEKQNRAKMIPIVHNNDNTESDSNRRHGFVNTFNSIRQMEARKHTLSYDLEREGWQVIDDANTDSRHNQNSKSTENDYYDDRRLHSESAVPIAPEKANEKIREMDSLSSDYEIKNKKKKSKKQKKKKKRKASTSSDSSDSDSDSDNENENQIENKPKKRSKKKKKKSKKKKRKVSSSSSSSENEEKVKKHKKKKKRKDSSSESESEDKSEDKANLLLIPQTLETNSLSEKSSSVINDVVTENVKTKDKKKSKRKSSDSDSSDSDSDVDNKKKKKKKKKRKTSKKRKHRSSSSSSDSSDSSESGDRKKKKRKKSKKSKSKKHKKKSEKKEKSKSVGEDKKKLTEEVNESEFVSVLSVGEPPLELKWPKQLIQYTNFLPSLQYSANPKVVTNPNDIKNIQQIGSISGIEEINKNQSIIGEESHELSTEYERFIDELNPGPQSVTINEETHSLESQLRDKLVKQYYERNDSKKQDLMTSSERRAFEKSKKQSYHSYDSSNQKRHEDLKSAPLSAYYSPKVPKGSPNHKLIDSENETKNNRSHERDQQNISLSIDGPKEESHKWDPKNNDSKTNDKKITARELLERVKQRKHSDKDNKDSKESVNRDNKPEAKSSKKLPQIGKMKTLSKKTGSKRSVTTANADSTQNTFVSQPMKLDMNFDYNWYYNYYMNSVYGVGQYPQMNDTALASAYYAHYSMLTSYDYSQNDLNSWVTQKGYTLENSSDFNNQIQTEVKSSEQIPEVNEKIIKTEESQPSVESSASEINTNNQTNDSIEQIVDKDKEAKDGQTLNNDIQMIDLQKNIEVLVSSSHSEIAFEELNEPKSESINGNPNVKQSPVSHDIESTNIDDSGEASPPPPPPPPRPLMTTLTSTEAFTLPNGQVLPAGTKQVVVHPYQTSDSNKFTAEWFSNALNSQNITQTNS